MLLVLQSRDLEELWGRAEDEGSRLPAPGSRLV
jgi:hypothetical protein